MRGWLLSLLLGAHAMSLAVNPVPIDGTQLTISNDKDVVPGSKSPDGRFAVATVYVGPTTATRIGLITADKAKFLKDIPTRSNNQTNEPYAKWLSVRWSPDSRHVAVHDTGGKHSKLAVFREQGGSFHEVPVADLSTELGSLAPKVGGKMAASGQMPLRWISDTQLEVELRARGPAAGSQAARRIVLALSPEGTMAVAPKR